MPPARRHDEPGRLAAPRFRLRTFALLLTLAGASFPTLARSASGDRAEPIAGAFIYPVGDELDFTQPHPGEPAGFTISDSYLVVRDGAHGERVHKGVDL
ncbi:MAG TPA: hypothetical protein VFT93_06575, partial [Candidatus Eisenbacteria bacterium]|nr:hypothetical protein [Candidatus Eisenbacteria bacterium]